MYRVSSVIIVLCLLISSSFGRGNVNDLALDDREREVWVALAVGSQTEQLETGHTLIFWGEGNNKDEALYSALNQCTMTAYYCFDLPLVTKRQFCRHADRGLKILFGSTKLLESIFPKSELRVFQSICLRL